jgi:soluble lytic murein transglycosylase-like protein
MRVYLAAFALFCALIAWHPKVPPVRVLQIDRIVLRYEPSASGFVSAIVVAPVFFDFGNAYARGFLYRATLNVAARRAFGDAAPVALLAAQIHAESAWQESVQSSAGALGMAQFMPATAQLMATRYPELGPVDRTDAVWSLSAQALHMRELFDLYPQAYTSCDRWAFALSAYNGGPKQLNKERALAADRNVWLKVAPQRTRSQAAWNENRAYVRTILYRLHPQYLKRGYAGVDVCA